MNRSGDAVAALARYYDIAAGRSAGGRGRGGAAVRQAAGAGPRIGGRAQRAEVGRSSGWARREFPRLRLGVGRGDARRDLADHVLSKFEADERPALEEFITRAADAAEMFAVDGIGKVMNVYNPEATAPEQPTDSLLPLTVQP